MGIKFLNFHSNPWYCFHVMGNHIACIQSLPPDVSPDRTIKLIRPDGRVQIYHRPIPASHLMLQFPKHLICHSDSFFIGHKIPPLSNSDYLLLGNKYFLLPTHFFQSVLSFVTVASIASSTFPSTAAAAAAKNKPDHFVRNIAACRLFDVHKTPSGTLQIRVSDEFIARLVEEEDGEEGEMMGEAAEKKALPSPKGRVCTTPELEKDYTRLVGCRREREWKPKLETIREKEKKKLAKLSALGMKKIKKSHVLLKGSQKTTSKKAEKLSPPPPPPPPKTSKKSKKAEKLPPPSPPPPPPPPPPTSKASKKSKKAEKVPPPPPPPPPSSKANKKSKKAEKVPPPPPPPPPPPTSKASKKSKKAEKLSAPPSPMPPPPPPSSPPQLKRGTEKQQTTPQQQQQLTSKKSKGKAKKLLLLL